MDYTVDWFSYPETSPEDGVEVLAYSPVWEMVVTVKEHFDRIGATHWAFLPKNKPEEYNNDD